LKINKNSTFTIIEWTGGQDRLQCTKNATQARWPDLEISKKAKLTGHCKDWTQISACLVK
jgi:hypothetical protein